MKPLLFTKLTMPPPRPNLVPREGLLTQLSESQRLGRWLTLVCAPAGYGKTALITDWLQQLEASHEGGGDREDTGIRIAWLSVDEGDNDPVQFFHYLIEALRRLDEGWGSMSSKYELVF